MEPISAIINLGRDIINKIFPNKDEANKHNIRLLELEQNGELEETKAHMSVLLAEAKSNDKWTSRARPSFLYVMYIMILFSIPMGILSVFAPHSVIQIESGMKGWLTSIPEVLWTVFGVGFGGYVIGRSYDKKQLLNIKK